MAPTMRYHRENVIEAAYELIRREGPDAFNARSVARELGSSTQPIFRLFTGMDELKSAVIERALAKWKAATYTRIQNSSFPYLSIGMAYLLFARDEAQLFRLLFMRDRVSDGSCTDYNINWGVPLIESSVGVDVTIASQLYNSNWLYCHGLAVAIATKYIPCMNECTMRQLLVESLQAAALHLNIQLPTMDQCMEI